MYLLKGRQVTKQSVSVSECVSHSVVSDCFVTLSLPGPLSMEFSRQDTGAGSHSLLQGNLPDPTVKPGFSALQADSLLSKPHRQVPNNMYPFF